MIDCLKPNDCVGSQVFLFLLCFLKKRRGDIYVFLSLSHRYAAVNVSFDLYEHVNMSAQNRESAIKVSLKDAHVEYVLFQYMIIE